MLTWLGREIRWLGVAIVGGGDCGCGCAIVSMAMTLVVIVVVVYCNEYIILLYVIYIILIY